MEMKCLTVARLSIIFFIGFASVQVRISSANSLTGTCASIGYSTACCPRSENCQAADGNCFCAADCHIFGDCCTDVYCPAHPRICRDVGITSCCSDDTGNGLCDVHFRDDENGRCSCNVTCHQRNDCCTDAASFCVPRTCTEAGKSSGCCMWSSTQSCFVPGGRCYCDSFCNYYNDCCTDVPSSANYQYCVGTLQLADRSRVQSDLEQDLKASTRLRYNEYNRRLRTENSKSQYTNGVSQRARAQRPRGGAREYRTRALNQRGG